MRARTSSPRLVSWVDVASSASGQRARRAAFLSWKTAGELAEARGSPPTSLSETSRL